MGMFGEVGWSVVVMQLGNNCQWYGWCCWLRHAWQHGVIYSNCPVCRCIIRALGAAAATVAMAVPLFNPGN